MTSSISFMTRMLSKFRKPEPASKQDYSWMSEEQVEWQNVRAIEMEMFDVEGDGGSKTIFHHPV
jgi:hypothetical protein